MKVALCIGVNEYKGLYFNTLRSCVNDVQDWEQTLFKFGYKILPNLTDEKAKRDAILHRIKDLFKYKSDISAVIMISSHGSVIPDFDCDENSEDSSILQGYDEVLVPYDVFDEGPLVDDEIYDLFTQIITERIDHYRTKIVFIVDACHSGSIAKSSFPKVVRNAASCNNTLNANSRTMSKYLPPETFYNNLSDAIKTRLKNRKSKIISKKIPIVLTLSACRKYQNAAQDMFQGRYNSVFTHYALQAVTKLSMSVSNYMDWINIINSNISEYYSQNPVIDGTDEMKKWLVFD